MNSHRKVIAAVGLAAIACALFLGAALATSAAGTSRWTDGAAIDEPESSARVRSVLWGPAEPARTGSGARGGALDEYEPRISADGTMMALVRRRPGSNADILAARRTPAGWTEPAPIDAVNSEHDELGPEISSDGLAIYFYSDRPGGLGGYDLWVSRDAGGGWGTPVNLGPAVNTEWNEYGPALTPDRATLYFSSNRPRAGEAAPPPGAWTATLREERGRRDYDLFKSDLTGGEPGAAVAVESLNAADDEGAPAVSPGGDFLYFASDRAGGAGGFDVWRARILNGRAGPPENLGRAVNSAFNDMDPALSADGFRLHFSSNRPLGPAPAGDAGTGESARSYAIWTSVSREVFREVRDRGDGRLARAWDAAWPWLLLLAVMAALLVLLLRLLRSQAWRKRMGQLSLLAKCVLISLLIHALAASGMAVWKVGSGIIDAVRREGGTRVILASSGTALDAGAGAVEQLRGAFSERSAIEPDLRAVSAPPSDEAIEAGRAEFVPPLLLVAAATPSEAPVHPVPPVESPRVEFQAALPPEGHESPVLPRAAPARPSLVEATPQVPAAAAGSFDAPALGAEVSSAVGRITPPTLALPTGGTGGASFGAAPLASAALSSPGLPLEVAAAESDAASRLPAAGSPRRATEAATTSVAISASPASAPFAPASTFEAPGSLVQPPKVATAEPAPHGTWSGELATATNPDISGSTVPLSAPMVESSADEAPIPTVALDATRRAGGTVEAAPHARVPLPGLAAPVVPAAPALAGGAATQLDAPSPKLGTTGAPPGPDLREAAATVALSGPPLAAMAGPGRAPLGDDVRLPSLPSGPVTPVETFAQRAPEVRGEVLDRMGGSAETERAVGLALDWFARHQEADGRWTGRAFDDRCGRCGDPAEFEADAAMTGLVLQCFLGAGHTHRGEGPYRDAVDRALRWLLQRQEPSGDLRRGETMYGQTVATVALCEALAMTSDQSLADPARRAVAFVLGATSRSAGGRSRDTAVLGWLVMTVESASRAGIDVPRDTFLDAGAWLDHVAAAPGRYAYQRGGEPSVEMTAEAMFVRQLIGHARTEPMRARSADFILAAPPKWSLGAPTHHWYYATLALFEHQGEGWERWNAALVPELLGHQRRDGPAAGSWDPHDRSSKLGGRLYQTAVCTLSLEVYYRYRPK